MCTRSFGSPLLYLPDHPLSYSVLFVGSESPIGESNVPVFWCLDITRDEPRWAVFAGANGDTMLASSPVVTTTFSGDPVILFGTENTVSLRQPIPRALHCRSCASCIASIVHLKSPCVRDSGCAWGAPSPCTMRQVWYMGQGYSCPSQNWDAPCSGNGECDCTTGYCDCTNTCFEGQSCSQVCG